MKKLRKIEEKERLRRRGTATRNHQPAVRPHRVAPPDKTFEINVRRQDPAKDIFIQFARLNGKEWNSFQFPAADLLQGGTLDLVLGPEPNQKWGIAR